MLKLFVLISTNKLEVWTYQSSINLTFALLSISSNKPGFSGYNVIQSYEINQKPETGMKVE